MSQPERISPGLRARILQELIHGAHAWRGRRRGVKYRFALSAQPDLAGKRIHYRAFFNRHRIEGVAGTLSEAINEIDREVEKLRHVA